MVTSLKSEQAVTVRENRQDSYVRKVIISHLEASMAGIMSPIERWADSNYAPRELVYVWNQHPAHYEIITPLHSFRAQDVRVDLSRGHVIILLSRDYKLIAGKGMEYYCEVPLPPDANRSEAVLEISADLLTIRVSRKHGGFTRFVSNARRFRSDMALLFGKSWNFGRIDS
ncbi:MAG: Hsp20/alpha crystallin family protein [Anaerolineae bacterium]